ncbi:MAG TPA: T9SS type A sorting domain-containing protein [Bacteroidetes bacterium]|nr:hypothetical protein BMS3Bbin04_00531 [bacterium BMS3Bbin04]HDO64534.1 T9SS type A sorting domain-containing protein [Bacteroidota bacterium]HEX03659.1 T9SS type A sorting domain-containing protein [Bacteroidota bacterium]
MHWIRKALILFSVTLFPTTLIFAQVEPVLIQEWENFQVAEYVISGNYAWGIGGTYNSRNLYRLDLSTDDGGSVVAQLENPAFGLDADNDLLVIAAGKEGIHLFDISDPDNIIWTRTFHMPGESKDVMLRDGYAYVACDYSGLVTVNVNDHMNPLIVDYQMIRHGEFAGLASQVKIQDSTLFLIDQKYGAVAYDLIEPTHPTRLDDISLELSSDYEYVSFCSDYEMNENQIVFSIVHNIYIYNQDEYITEFSVVLASFDDNQFTEQSTLDFGYVFEIQTSSSIGLYESTLIASQNDILFIKDISDPFEPYNLFIYPDSTLENITVYGDVLYALGNNFSAFSMTGQPGVNAWLEIHKAHPSVSNTSEHSCASHPLQVDSGWRVTIPTSSIADQRDWTITEIAQMQLVPAINADRLYAQGAALYIPEYAGIYLNDIHIIDVSQQDDPIYSGVCQQLDGENYFVTISDDMMIVLCDSGIKYFDLSDPIHPQWISTSPLNVHFFNIAVSGGILYGTVDTIQERLYIYDISDLQNVVLLDIISDMGDYIEVDKNNRFMTIVNVTGRGQYNWGFTISKLFALDWTENTPYLLKEWYGPLWDTYFRAQGLTVSNNLHYFSQKYVYYENEIGDVTVRDISDPLYPITALSDVRQGTANPQEMVQHGNLMIYSFEGLNLYDVSNPSDPELISQIPEATDRKLALDWPYLYGTNGQEITVYLLGVTDVKDVSSNLPSEFAVGLAYPNPFNPTTTITVSLPQSAELTVAVFNTLGQRVAELANGLIAAGTHQFTFDGSSLASGVYLVQATVPGELNAVQKILLMK